MYSLTVALNDDKKKKIYDFTEQDEILECGDNLFIIVYDYD